MNVIDLKIRDFADLEARYRIANKINALQGQAIGSAFARLSNLLDWVRAHGFEECQIAGTTLEHYINDGLEDLT